MLNKFITKFVSYFKTQTLSERDRFILSKHPQTLADIEYWSKQYEFARGKGGLV